MGGGRGGSTNPTGDAHRCAHAKQKTKSKVESTAKNTTSREEQTENEGEGTHKRYEDAAHRGKKKLRVKRCTHTKEKESEECTPGLKDEGGRGDGGVCVCGGGGVVKETNTSTGDRRGYPATESYSSACLSANSIMKGACGRYHMSSSDIHNRLGCTTAHHRHQRQLRSTAEKRRKTDSNRKQRDAWGEKEMCVRVCVCGRERVSPPP